MAWRDELRPGSFRGVLFYIESAEQAGGRRTVLNEFPLRDEPTTEDLGRKARQYTLEMFLLGADYMAQRDRLIAALETGGPGSLVHPYRGELQVVAYGDYRVSESTREGGMARISVTFVEAGSEPRPDNRIAQGSLAGSSADALETEALAEFEEAWNVVGLPSFVAEEAITLLQLATKSIQGAGGLLEGGGQFHTLYRRLTGSFTQLILSPGNLAGQLFGLVKSMSSTSNPWQALRAQFSLFNLGSQAKAASGGTSLAPARQQVQTNQDAVYRLIERAAVSESVRLAVNKPASSTSTSSGLAVTTPASATSGGSSGASSGSSGSAGAGTGSSSAGSVPGVGFDNRDQAIEVRDQILDELDRQQLEADPVAYQALVRITADLVTEMNAQAANLAPLSRVTLNATQPALLVAHRLYGDARRADDIVNRNHIAHPGFVPGGVELEILKDA